MAIQIGDNFSYQGKKYIEERMSFDSISEMASYPETSVPEGFITYVVSENKHYQYNSANSVDATTGRWREYNTGSGGDSAKTLVDDNNTIAANGGTRLLFNDDSEIVANWGNKTLVDNEKISLDWETKDLYDRNSNASLNWDNRELINSTGEYIVNWSGDTATYKGNEILSDNGTVINRFPMRSLIGLTDSQIGIITSSGLPVLTGYSGANQAGLILKGTDNDVNIILDTNITLENNFIDGFINLEANNGYISLKSIEVEIDAGTTVFNTSNILYNTTNFNIETGSVGLAVYNGYEIATVNKIPDTSNFVIDGDNAGSVEIKTPGDQTRAVFYLDEDNQVGVLNDWGDGGVKSVVRGNEVEISSSAGNGISIVAQSEDFYSGTIELRSSWYDGTSTWTEFINLNSKSITIGKHDVTIPEVTNGLRIDGNGVRLGSSSGITIETYNPNNNINLNTTFYGGDGKALYNGNEIATLISYVDITVIRNVSNQNSIREAMNNISDASPTKIYRLHIPAGEWFECDIIGKKYIELHGEGINKTIIYCDGNSSNVTPSYYSISSDANKPLSSIANVNKHVIYGLDDIYCKDITFKGATTKYVAHLDSSLPSNLYFENCEFISEVNTKSVVGCGFYSEQKVDFINCIFTSIIPLGVYSRAGLYIHSAFTASEEKPFEVNIVNSQFRNCSYLLIDSFDSGQINTINLINCINDSIPSIQFRDPSATKQIITNVIGTNIDKVVSIDNGFLDTFPPINEHFTKNVCSNYNTSAKINDIVAGDLIQGDLNINLECSKYDGTKPFYGIALNSTDENGFVDIVGLNKIVNALVSGTVGKYINISPSNTLEFSATYTDRTIGVYHQTVQSNSSAYKFRIIRIGI